MSASETSSLVRIPSPTKIKAEHHIALVDHTISRTPSYFGTDAHNSDNEGPAATPGASSGLYKRMTNNSIRQTVRQEYARQKYAKYSQERYNVKDGTRPPDEDTANAPQVGQEASAIQKSYLERAQTRAKALLQRKKTLGKGDAEDIVVDVLYENQRGMFFFGIPKYSSNSLLPSDPRPWQNGQFRTSAVDIRNAQVPDPSWEWAWKSWYVDMSRDVDEEGWEYSFAFVGKGGATFAWHGNHPWFHSFVRRRRWLRMRRRKDTTHHTKERGHELTADYFTIHPKSLRSGQTSSNTDALVKAPFFDVDEMEINSIGDLFLALRKSTIDREKIVAIKKFASGGGDELFYLGDRMEDIMGMLMFQSSRRQLLNDLTSRHEEAHREQKELDGHQHEDSDEKQVEHNKKAKHAENLLKAVHAAEEQVQRLEYWSDIKGLGATAANGREEDHDMPSFKNKQKASEGTRDLHQHAEHADDTASKAPSKKSSIWYDSDSKRSKGKDGEGEDDDELDRYTTASETPSEKTTKSKGKGKARALDGVAEEPGDEGETLVNTNTGARGNRRSVQIVDPVPEDMTGLDGDDSDQYSSGLTSPASPIDRGEAKTPDSVAGFMKEMRRPKNWIDQAFG
ncbi:hypothetical protein PRZ48_005078 [Zasmidium cellare]|uniref:Peroxin/Ferlin domain-containing protein n=1 Tax=Zasmidium cellare TaxID=395010 RepID=A0ABR0ERJ8_ZASCE|nr:hypothetical protein PRZ48_005078 [Zasmidium cellare]